MNISPVINIAHRISVLLALLVKDQKRSSRDGTTYTTKATGLSCVYNHRL